MKILNMESLKSDIDSLNKKIQRLESSLTVAKLHRDALVLVVDRFTEKPKRPVRRSENLSIAPEKLKGMKLEGALVCIAENNGGIVNSTASRELLEEAGVLTGSQRGHTLWNALQSSDQFEKVGRGKYRLIDDEEIDSSNIVRYVRDSS